ncbi:hypothetical protein E1265_14300 [Streptomyces sp. 8K308]|uniref:hypothetical protein n=1 Tax=Streptomyces sp. 8K308 TaxID=2530388 RepID=UPI001053C09F|nr:hypothetical protein [Streptomyces sp. 8K308]TDC22947.1 hypothetical protein E1265_14300 [Streptomyces sp. 8K308]
MTTTSDVASPARLALVVSRARAAARSGDGDEALRLLRPAGDPAVGGHRDVLDLLARVHAQRGEWEEAAAAWRLVRERHPEDAAAAAGLARVERLRRGGAWAALARHRGRTALVAAVCAVTAVTGVGAALVGGADAGPAERAGRTAPGPEAGQEHEAAQDPAAERAAEQAARQDERRAAAEALARALDTSGLRAVARGPAVTVVFDDGLFSTADRLTPVGAELLATLGERLAGREVTVEVRGHAAAVPGAPDSGGSVVALWRALVAARELSEASGHPLTAFTTASADQREAPHASAERNRTVTLLITPG